MLTPPSSTTGDSWGIGMEGRARVDVDNDGSTNTIPITSQIAYLNPDGGDATPRRDIVDIVKCNDCHGVLGFHGDNRVDNVQVCALCHNPNLGRNGVAADMKVMIHKIHRGASLPSVQAGGRYVMSFAFRPATVTGGLSLNATGDKAKLVSLEARELRSIWQ